jgi:hypothetical protein
MKNLTLLILLFTCIFTTLLSCKSSYTHIGDKSANYIPYYLKVNEADSLFLVGNYQKSHKILDSLFQKYEPANTDRFYEYGTYLLSCMVIGDAVGIKKKIAFSYKKFGGMYAPVYPTDKRTMLENIYKKDSIYFLKQRKKYLKKIDYSLIKKLQEMIKLDQSNRCLDTPENYRKINTIDSINSIRLKDVIKDNVYPNYYYVGYFEPELNNNASILILLMHQDRKTVFKYLPIIEDAVKKGKCSPYDYAVIYDKCIMANGYENEKQKYNSLETDTKQEINSIANKNRKRIGLPSVGYFKWK